MFEDIISVSGFPNLRVLELDQHVCVTVTGELGGVAPEWKNGSFYRHGMDRVGFRSGIR